MDKTLQNQNRKKHINLFKIKQNNLEKKAEKQSYLHLTKKSAINIKL